LTQGLIDERERDEAQLINNKLEAAIKSGDWLRANDLSNKLEDYVVTRAHVDEDNILFPSDPMADQEKALHEFLNQPGVKAALNVKSGIEWKLENGALLLFHSLNVG
jgi:hypothetical protein